MHVHFYIFANVNNTLQCMLHAYAQGVLETDSQEWESSMERCWLPLWIVFVKPFQAAQVETAHLVLNGATSSITGGSIVPGQGFWAKTYCEQKEVRTSKWVLLLDDWGTGTRHFFIRICHSQCMKILIDTHHFSHPISKYTRAHARTHSFTLDATMPTEDIVAFKQFE